MTETTATPTIDVHNNYGGTVKKIIVTIVATVLLALGCMAPASADEPTPSPDPAPTDCDQTVQEWQTRALTAEEERDRFLDKLLLSNGYLHSALQQLKAKSSEAAVLTYRLDQAEDRIAAVEARRDLVVARKNARIERRDERIADLREQLREARQG